TDPIAKVETNAGDIVSTYASANGVIEAGVGVEGTETKVEGPGIESIAGELIA
ncbi:2409_t:CDS:1, partial [Ambispora gerdemannii]